MRILAPRLARVGDAEIRRTLPHAEVRTIGPFCFLDHFGPHPVDATSRGVGPHPHIGLQTVTWLFEGATEHGDSLGFRQLVRPGQLNLMTAGRGIAHWEYPRPEVSGVQHGVQLWVALPDALRRGEPAFEHHAALPEVAVAGWTARVFLGALAGARSPATTVWPTVGAELRGQGPLDLPVDPAFEHGLLVDAGAVRVGELDGRPGDLLHLPPGPDALALRVDGPARLVLIGGAPFPERPLLWWNFAARTHEEIAAARADWEAGRGFGDPAGWPEPPTPAPELVGHLRPR